HAILRKCGSGRRNMAAKCIHGGAAFVWPLIQDYAYLRLEPMAIEIPLEGALSLNNIRVNVPCTFTVGISTDPALMNNAAERLLMLDEKKIHDQAQDIILGQLRLVIATLSIEEINKDREKFMHLVNENVAQEINKIGVELINVNVRDITDESGYIEANGKRDASEAINRARAEVAEREQEIARLAKEHLAPQEIEKKRIEIAAAAEAEKRRIEAQGEADATLAKFTAQAEGMQKVLEAKAEGYRQLIAACGSNPQVGPT